MTTHRNIGGSILPSSAPQILQPMQLGARILQVHALPEIDSHGLFVETPHGPCLLATHGNGYSCHSLAKRMIAGDAAKVREQAEYILDCGGTCRKIEHVLEYLN